MAQRASHAADFSKSWVADQGTQFSPTCGLAKYAAEAEDRQTAADGNAAESNDGKGFWHGIHRQRRV
jgi:hypothetical protein